MVTKLSREAEKAIAAMDWVDRGIPEDIEEQSKALIELNKLLRLLAINYRLKEGWGKYISDQAIKRFGKDNADEKIRNVRNSILRALSTKSNEELKTISEGARRGIIEERLIDYEAPVRPVAAELYRKLFQIGDYRHFKVNPYSPLPFVMISAEKRKNVFALDKFYIDKKTRNLFENEKAMGETMSLLAEAVAYMRGSKKDLKKFNELEKDNKAISLAKALYKLMHKNIRGDLLGNRTISAASELFNDGMLEQGLIKLRNFPAFEPTIKNMTNVYLVDFNPRHIDLYGAEGKCRFYFDPSGRANILQGIEKHPGMGTSYLFSMTIFFNYMTARLSGLRKTVFDNHFGLCWEALNKNEPSKKIGIQSTDIEIFATAGYNDLIWSGGEKPERVGQALIGVRRFVITLPETKRRVKFALTDSTVFNTGEEFVHNANAILNNSLIYTNAVLLYPETGVLDYGFYTTPEVETLFNNFTEDVKFNKNFADLLNMRYTIKTARPAFNYARMGGYKTITASVTPAMVMKALSSRRSRK